MAQKISLVLLNLIFGSLILFSYYKGLTKEPELSLKLWGGVPKTLQPYIISSMFISAIGYFLFTANFLFNVDPENFKFLGKFNYWSLHIIYLLILIPSMLWIDLTFSYIKTGDLYTWYYIVLILYCVGIFSVILFLFTVDTYVDNYSWLYLPSVFGACIFTIHTMFLDGLLWTTFFHKNIN